MSFKDLANADIHDVFLNTDEFAENRTIRYDGVDYTGPEGLGVAVVLNGDRKRTRQRVADDYSEGLYRRTEIAHLAKADLGGRIPEAGKYFYIDDGTGHMRQYKVASAIDTMGMLRIELEVLDE